MGVKHPSDGDDLGAGLGAIHPSSWTHRPMLRRVISPPLRGGYPLHQQHRDCELPAAQRSPMNRGHFPSDEAVIKLLWLAICDTCGQASPRTRQGERTASIQAQGQGQARRRTDHHRLEQGPGPAHHRLPRPNQPLPVKRLHRKLDRSLPLTAICTAIAPEAVLTLRRNGLTTPTRPAP